MGIIDNLIPWNNDQFHIWQVYTWGHRLVTPRRVVITRNLKKSGSTLLKFHRMERLHVISITAGVMHSTALTDDGALFYWVSSDPDLKCQQVIFCLNLKLSYIQIGMLIGGIFLLFL